MRMSCNGCRVLRKGCGRDCTIRPCLQWIRSPEAQANATVFLAKFYGRAGLLNLINSGPPHLRPAIFRSLLHEACGRVANPIYGSVGLLSSGKWQMCQAAVEAVLRGAPIVQMPCETAANTNPSPMPSKAAYDIRHVSKARPISSSSLSSTSEAKLHRVSKLAPHRFKRPAAAAAKSKVASAPFEPINAPEIADNLNHPPDVITTVEIESENGDVDDHANYSEEDRMDAAASHVSHQANVDPHRSDHALGLELTLGPDRVGFANDVQTLSLRGLQLSSTQR